MMSHRTLAAGALLALLAACSTDPQSSLPLSTDLRSPERHATDGAVVVATNDAAANALLVFPRERDGTLGAPETVATGGTGTGTGLGNQGGVATAGRYLLVVNAGSNDVSVFARNRDGLQLTDRHASGGTLPISVAVRGHLVYVLNGGDAGNVAGFRLGEAGQLRPLHDAVRPLSNGAAGPAQVGLSPDGRFLVVTEKANNAITRYRVRGDGALGAPETFHSSGETPFGFAFDPRGHLLVSEAFGGAPGASALSSYSVSWHGALRPISASVGTTQTAACWVAVSPDGRYAYVTNTGSASVTGYRIGPRGELRLLDASGVTGQTGMTPIDLAITDRGGFLYTLNAGSHTLSGFVPDRHGSLSPLDITADVPAGTNGMVAW